MTKLLDDCLVYGGGTAAALLIEHLIAGGTPELPRSAPELARVMVARYAVGSATILGAVGIWALRRPTATAREAVGLQTALLLIGGGTVAAAYWLRAEQERREAATLIRQFGDEANGRFPPAVPNRRRP